MSCECYKIGGPFIAEDPDCAEHGTEAKLRRQAQEEKRAAEQHGLEDRISAMESDLRARISALEVQVESLRRRVRG